MSNVGTTRAIDKEIDNDGNRFLTKSSSLNALIFSRTYIVVTPSNSFVTRFPNGGDFVSFLEDFDEMKRNDPTFKGNSEFSLQGSSTTQKGGVFDTSSVELVNVPEGVEYFTDVTPNGGYIAQFAGDLQPRFLPVENPFYFFHGQCVATSGILEPAVKFDVPGNGDNTFPQPVITSNTCRLNLCLGGGGFDCIAIYSGTAFVFNLGKGIRLNNERTSSGSSGKVVSFQPPPLPPPFPATIIGGTGSFEGIEGSVNIATIAGTTGPLADFVIGNSKLVFLQPIGVIVQVISVKSNMPLPPGP